MGGEKGEGEGLGRDSRDYIIAPKSKQRGNMHKNAGDHWQTPHDLFRNLLQASNL